MLQQALAGKTILSMKPEFFSQNGQSYWTIYLEYELLLTPLEKVRPEKQLIGLDQQLFTTLQQWRKEQAQTDGVPVYVVATNKELTEIATKHPNSLAALQTISGFGQKKSQKYGENLIKLVKRFEQDNKETTKQIN